jgi:hypothetical protein
MELPTFTHKNITYYVDNRLQEFRSKVEYPEMINFVGFKTDLGQEILAAMDEAE